ncbi:putative increased recombination centers protein 19 [[Candida] railenensis]|uniref:Increased recombination centers protein 19 n=1 Tax=[Candida] railenensis TaxID=45579 RepID=A0A9P0QUI2_9ASCO|nr:putative increased recombination centers protein 19 [[Candida] railenensis]
MSFPIVSKFGVLVPKSYTITYSSIENFSYKKQLLVLYKRFYKLRLYQADSHSKMNYVKYLKRKIKYEDFNLRRRIFLEQNCVEDLSPTDIVRRMVNTLAFVQNASVFNRTYENEARLNGNKNSSKETSGLYAGTIESQILATILHMEYSMPTSVKVDHKFSWVDKLNMVVSQIETPLKFEKSSLKMESTLVLMGYIDYQENLMSLNESYRICL